MKLLRYSELPKITQVVNVAELFLVQALPSAVSKGKVDIWRETLWDGGYNSVCKTFCLLRLIIFHP